MSTIPTMMVVIGQRERVLTLVSSYHMSISCVHIICSYSYSYIFLLILNLLLHTGPLPSGRVTYGSQLLCCEGAYAGQSSEACLQDIPGYAPPTSAPSVDVLPATSAPSVDVLPETTYYVATWGWPSSTCSNERPLPYYGVHLFDTKEECCEQSSSTEGNAKDECVSN